MGNSYFCHWFPLLCGIPGSLWILLIARMIQAIGASMTMATGTGIITEVFPMSERGRALGMMGAFVSLGSITGPGVGGFILAHFDWPVIFLINVPVGIITILVGQRYLPKDTYQSHREIDYLWFCNIWYFYYDVFGGVFLGQEFGFNRPRVLLLFVLAFISFYLFYE